ncbi:MAG TPA: hypothetical protein ENL22_07760, partial [candidate division Zixibacteria bacterium]|nr:hypothetical protein [candidate division Zixibacteria bacterium]
MRKIAFSLPVLLILIFSYSGAATYHGRVVDRDSSAVEGVNIQTDVPSLHTVTDKNGEFVLETGNFVPSYITFSHVSFRPKMVSLSAEKSTEIKVALE